MAFSTSRRQHRYLHAPFGLGQQDAELAEVGQGWARRIANQVPDPTTPEGITWWLGELIPLRPLLKGVENQATRGLRPFRGQLDAARAKGGALWPDCLRAWRELGLAPEALEALVAPPRASDSSGLDGSRKSKKQKKGKKR